MKYNEFVEWCNERACDGRWSMRDALVCIEIVKQINSVKCKWWKRRKEKEEMWNKFNSELGLEEKLVQWKKLV